MVKSITTAICALTFWRGAISSGRIATPRPFSIFTRSMTSSALTTCEECSRLPFGTAASAGCSGPRSFGSKASLLPGRPGRLAFASELRTLRELLPWRPKSIPQSVYDFFGFRYIPAPRTFYRGVEKLLPGHFLVADSSGVRSNAYWDIPPEEETAKSSARKLPLRLWNSCASLCGCV
jgi:hypothetical protein